MNPALVHDRDGQPATLLDSEPDSDGLVPVRLASGTQVRFPVHILERMPSGAYRADLSFSAFTDGEREVFQEIEERLHVDRRVRETGRVRVTTHVDAWEEVVDEPGWRETVDVERVPVGAYVDEVALPRREGDVLVVPIYEEVLVVQKRLLLREEVRLVTRRDEVRDPQRVVLRRQRVEVEHVPAPTPDA